MELSEFSSSNGLSRPIDHMFALEDWLDGDYRCCMKLKHLKARARNSRMTEMLSLYLRVQDSSGILPDRTFETRLYLDAETRLITETQASMIVGGHHSLKKATYLFMDHVQDDISKQSLESWQKTLSAQPCAVFLRDDLGNVALSVSKLLSIRLILALTIQGCSEIGPAINFSIASRARIAGSQCLRVRVSLSP